MRTVVRLPMRHVKLEDLRKLSGGLKSKPGAESRSIANQAGATCLAVEKHDPAQIGCRTPILPPFDHGNLRFVRSDAKENPLSSDAQAAFRLNLNDQS